MPKGTPPPRKRPSDLAGYLEALSRPVFQAGISWRVVDAKWDGIRRAFREFDPAKVAKFGPKQIDRLMENEAVIRSRAKIEAVVDNAQTLLELDGEHGGFRRYLKAHGDAAAVARDLQRQFRFIGQSGAYMFLYTVGEPVPPHDEWPAVKSRRTSPGGR
ncbi:MAG: DNA-3-methyladenine glycosylase I [Solirubrobacteraceae bacterium]